MTSKVRSTGLVLAHASQPKSVSRLNGWAMASVQVRSEQRFAWHGQSLLIMNARGECSDADSLTGYYYREARFLRQLRLVVDRTAPWLCETATESPVALVFSYVLPEMTTFGGGGSGVSGEVAITPPGAIPCRALDIRARYVVDIASLTARVTVINHGLTTVTFDAGWELAADFADIQEALGGQRQQNATVHAVVTA